MHFGRNLCEKRQIWVSELRSGEVRGDARPWLMARWKADVDFLLALMELFFAIYYGSGVMGRNMYSSAVSDGGRSLCSQILPRQGRPPSTIVVISCS